MSTLSVVNPTLLDLARRTDPGGKIDAIVEILNQTNEILLDMTFVEGNLTTGHRTTIRTGIPAPTWRKINGGVQPNKSTTAQVTFGTGMLEAYAEVDKALADLNGNTAAFRLSEDKPHIEGMNIEMADTLFHGNETTEPEAFTGLGAFYNDSTASNGENILKAGGGGADNSSIWLVVWSPETVFGIVPKGSRAGIQTEDKGQVTIENQDGSNGRMEAYRTHYRWDAGLVVRDWRYVVRIANIDKSDLTYTAASGADLINLMMRAEELIPNLSAGRAVWYTSRNIKTFLRGQMTAAVKSSTLSVDMVAGRHVLSFDSIPVRRVDQLAADEAVVV
jgi:hypothetical protein